MRDPVPLSLAAKIELRAGDYAASIAPASGARVTSLVCHRDGEARRLLVGSECLEFDAHHWPKAGAFPMLPFANRLPAEGFLFDGVRVVPAPGPAGFPVHGVAHRRRWAVLEVSQHHVLMRYVHPAGDEGWPWSWSAHEEVRLSAAGLVVRLEVRNDSAHAMPLTMGFHPYQPLPTDAQPADLWFDAHSRWELDGEGQAAGDQRTPRFELGRGETVAFDGWDGRLVLRHGHGGWMHVACDGCGSLVLHRPTQGDYVCAEPVTALPGRITDGAAVLLPGHSRTLSWACSWSDEAPLRRA